MISAEDYSFLQVLLKERSGLALGEGKDYLLEGRLGPVARGLGFGSISELVQHLKRSPRPDAALASVVEAMTTNETLFFRDQHPFDALKTLMLPHLASARPGDQPIRIWCTAASAGQEPYSIAMIVAENRNLLAGRRVDILASDISAEMLSRAADGLYSDFEVRRGLDPGRLERFFTREGQHWRLCADVRRAIRFERINLLDRFDHLGHFDIVFCRNVLIYFDMRTKLDVVHRIASRLEPDGFLTLGGAETLVGLTDRFRPHHSHRSVFRPATETSGESQPTPVRIGAPGAASPIQERSLRRAVARR